MHPDDFIELILLIHEKEALKAVKRQLSDYQNPRLSIHELLARYTNNGIPNTASRLRKLIS